MSYGEDFALWAVAHVTVAEIESRVGKDLRAHVRRKLDAELDQFGVEVLERLRQPHPLNQVGVVQIGVEIVVRGRVPQTDHHEEAGERAIPAHEDRYGPALRFG